MDNRKKLIEEAINQFAIFGYNGCSVQNICQKAGVTKPTLYHFFGSKEGLLKTLLKERLEPFLDKISSMTYISNFKKELEVLTREFFNFALNNPKLYRFYLALIFSASDSPEFKIVARYLLRLNSIINEFFVKATKEHGNFKGREYSYTISYIGMVNSYITNSYYSTLMLNRELSERATGYFINGIMS